MSTLGAQSPHQVPKEGSSIPSPKQMVALVRALVEAFLPNSPVSHRIEKNARSGRRPLDNAAPLDVGVTQSKLHEPAIRNSNDLDRRKLASRFMLLNAQINRIRHWFII